MSQKNINFGSYPDDPGADPIRSAFEKTQQNFNELYAGVEGAQVLSVNRTAGAGITVNRPTGNVVISANISCVQVSSTTLNIRRAGQPDGSYGAITASNQILLIDLPGNIAFPDKIQNGSTNVTTYQSGLVAFSMSGTSNVVTFSNSQANFSNGYSITGANMVSANYFVGDGSLLTGIGSSYGNSDVANYLPTYTGNLSSGNASLGNSVTANYFIGDGSLLTGLPAGYSNNDVANYLPTYTGNLNPGNVDISGNLGVTGNSTFANAISVGGTTGGTITGANMISANYFVGNGSLLTGIGSSYGNSDVANYLPTYSGNLSAGNASLGNSVTANYFIGDGSLLTGIGSSYGNSDVANYLPTYTGNLSASDASLGNSVTANYFIGDGSLLTGILTGNVSELVNGTSNVIVTNSGNVSTSVNGNANIFVVTTDGANIVGNLDITGNSIIGQGIIIGNGTNGQLTGANLLESNNVTTNNLTINNTANLGSISNIRISNGTINQVVSATGDGNVLWRSLPYDVCFFVSGTPANNATIYRYISPRDFAIASSFVGSFANSNTTPSTTSNINITLNGSSIGNIGFTNGNAGIGTFSGIGGNVVAGDILRFIISPVNGVSNIAISIRGDLM